MKCPICGKELELLKKQVGVEENGTPVFHQYAVCRACKKQWDLDKQRAKKKVSVDASATKPIVKKAERPERKAGLEEKKATAPKKAAPSERKETSVKKSAPNRPVSAQNRAEREEQRYANIPSERVRTKKEKAVRQAYEEMLSTDPNYRPKKRKSSGEETTVSKKAVRKKAEDVQAEKRRLEPEKKRPNTKPAKDDDDYDDDYDEEFDYMDDEPNAKYRVLRVILGILSVLAFGYFGYQGFLSGLDSVASGGALTDGIAYIVLAICMLVSGLFLLILQNSRSIVAYLLPMILYLGSGVFVFMKRGEDQILLYSAIGCAVLALLLIILAITSRNQEDDYDYDDEDDYDDSDEDDYE